LWEPGQTDNLPQIFGQEELEEDLQKASLRFLRGLALGQRRNRGFSGSGGFVDCRRAREVNGIQCCCARFN
jgi:hypothetical protein